MTLTLDTIPLYTTPSWSVFSVDQRVRIFSVYMEAKNIAARWMESTRGLAAFAREALVVRRFLRLRRNKQSQNMPILTAYFPGLA